MSNDVYAEYEQLLAKFHAAATQIEEMCDEFDISDPETSKKLDSLKGKAVALEAMIDHAKVDGNEVS